MQYSFIKKQTLDEEMENKLDQCSKGSKGYRD